MSDNNNLHETDAKNGEKDKSSVCDVDQRMEWFIASEVAGCGDFPTSDRWTRDHLAKLAEGKDHLKRKRKGTKATEYHISLFSAETQLALVGDKVHDASRSHVSERMPQYEGLNVAAYKDFTEEFALIPGYRVQVSAGHGSFPPENLEPTRHLAFRRKWLKFRGFKETDLAIVWAKGDSMEPTINNNDTLVVHLGRNTPADGHIYIFRSGDELFVKRYQSVLGMWRLISDNPIYDKVDIKKEDQHQFDVVGQVVHIAKDIGD